MPSTRQKQNHSGLLAFMAVSLSLACGFFSCNREFDNSLDPRGTGFLGDSLTLDTDGNGIADIIDEFAPGCQGPSCIDSALAHRKLGLGRHPRIVSLASDTLISIFDTLHINLRALGLYPVTHFEFEKEGDSLWKDSSLTEEKTLVFGDSGLKVIRLRALAEANGGRFFSRDTVIKVQVALDRPQAAISGMASVHVGQPVVFTGVGIQHFGSIVRYKWDDGESAGWDDSSGASLQHTFTIRGPHTVRLYVRDDDGNADSTSIITSVLNEDPVLKAILRDTTLSSRDTLRFNLVATDPDSILEFLWDFNSDGIFDDTSKTGVNKYLFPDISKKVFVSVEARDPFDGKVRTSAIITVDANPPGAPLVRTTSIINATRPTWTWISQPSLVDKSSGTGTYRCILDDSDFTHASTQTTGQSFQAPADLSEGQHTLYVQERDLAGNWSPIGSASATVDITPPKPPRIIGPTSPNTTRRPTWKWSTGGQGGSGVFAAKLDSLIVSASPFATNPLVDTVVSFTPSIDLADGMHTLYLQERDSAGNWSEFASASVTIDATPPPYPLVSCPPSPTRDTLPIWNWFSQGGGGMGSFRYKLDQFDLESQAQTTTTRSFRPESKLPEGSHTVYVQERDTAGNWSLTSVCTITIDITPPIPPLVTTSPFSPTNVLKPTWLWTPGGGGNGKYRFKLDDSASVAKADTTTKTNFTPLADLNQGAHVLFVQERDSAGNWSELGRGSIYVDGQRILAPSLTVTPLSPTANTRPTWSWSGVGAGGSGTFQYKLDDSLFTIGANSTTKTSFTPGWDLTEGLHTLYVQEKDGSGNWSFTASKSINIAMTLPSFHTGFMGTSSGLFKTVDGGATWYQKQSGYNHDRLFFIDVNTGWATSNFEGYFYKTVNGGSNWSAVGTFNKFTTRASFYKNPNLGWVVGDQGSILNTQNAGISWINQSTGSTNLNDIFFVDDNVGWVVGSGGTILKTQNGGSLWLNQSSGRITQLSTVQFVDASTGWCAGDSGIILKTSNGGDTWTRQSTGIATAINSLNFVDANTGWAAGANATILKTSDGGLTWIRQNSYTKFNLNSISFYDANVGWAVGDSGAVVKTMDGGMNWVPQPSGISFSIRSVCFPKNSSAGSASPPVVKAPSDTNTSRPIWTWTSGGGGTGAFRYALDNADLNTSASLTYSSAFSPPGDLTEGPHTLYVQERNTMGAWSASGSAAVNVDLTPPGIPMVSILSKWTNNTKPIWSWSSSGGGSGTYRFQLDDSLLTSAATMALTSYTYGNNLTEGIHKLFLRERDLAGNWSGLGSGMVIIDITPPLPPAITGPPSPTSRRRPTWSWSASPGCDGVYRFKLDTIMAVATAPAVIQTTFTPTTDLSSGLHTLYVQDRDSAGNWSTSASVAVQVNWTQPGLPIITSTPSPTNNPRPNWSWSSGGGGIGVFRFQLDDSTFASVTPGPQLTFVPGADLSEGKHTLYVQEQDSLGYWSALGKSLVKVDLTPPAIPIVVTLPPSPTNIPRPSWTWSSGGGGNGTYKFRLDDADLSAATPGIQIYFTPTSDLANGAHTLYAQEQDSAGNWSPTGSAAIYIDATRINPPSVLVSPASPTGNPRPTWSWSGDPKGVNNFRYKLNDTDLTTGATLGAGTSFTPTADLPEGEHTLYVQQQDSSGIWSFSGSRLIKVTFILPDAHVGFVGGYGIILKTFNGGSSWLSKSTSFYSYSIQFVDTNTGFSDYSGIRKTTDGGVTWNLKLSLGSYETIGSKISFLDQNLGWIVWSGGGIYKTVNGGDNWLPQSSGVTQDLTAVYFVDANTGWSAGIGGTILTTLNGGASWFTQTSGTPNNLFGIQFVNPVSGWAVGNNSTVLRTSNGGINWSPVTGIPNRSYYSLCFINATLGWVVGGSGTILKTMDGGNSWVQQTNGTTASLYSVRFLDANTGWAVGSGGTILKTIDGGATWVAQISGTTAHLYSISFP